MGSNILSTLTVFLALGITGKSAAQIENIKYLTDNAVEGKAYFIAKANADSKKTFTDQEGFYIKMVPAVYKTVIDTIVLQPALNGDLDTANYFIETEVLVVSEPSAEWRTAQVSELCIQDGISPFLTFSLQKKSPEYQIVNRKFFPFKNILDVSEADNVIPEVLYFLKRNELVQKARLETYPLSQKPELNPGEKLLEIPAGEWQHWEQIQCPYGDYKEPKPEEIQQELLKRGYKLSISGKMDTETKQALHEFQADNDLEIGKFNDETAAKLGLKRERLIRIEN